ncbi:MAG: GNAT family N-acetyltransferase [Proteobacteria bacterium]|nr:GNAT family N-acetyltransferase [Pseudomonadota bacterium]
MRSFERSGGGLRLHGRREAGKSMEIVDFEPAHAAAFKALNEAWISKHFTLEAKDREVLDDPQGKILARGGRIFMAMQDGRAVGCVALLNMADGGYEVAKMTVSEDARGAGLGRRLMQRCIDAGSERGAPRLYLETNSSLAPALGLYRAMGFKHLAPTETPYVRADVFMERRY